MRRKAAQSLTSRYWLRWGITGDAGSHTERKMFTSLRSLTQRSVLQLFVSPLEDVNDPNGTGETAVFSFGKFCHVYVIMYPQDHSGSDWCALGRAGQAVAGGERGGDQNFPTLPQVLLGEILHHFWLILSGYNFQSLNHINGRGCNCKVVRASSVFSFTALLFNSSFSLAWRC